MTKSKPSDTERMQAFFEEWKITFPEQSNDLITDGYLTDDGAAYREAKTKVLFLEKEPNDPKGGCYALHQIWEKGLKGGFSIRMGEWAAGVQQSFPEYMDVYRDKDKKTKAFHSSALINIKKTWGGSSSNMEEIRAHALPNRLLLQKQIRLLNPHVIIGGTGQTDVWDDLFGKDCWNKAQSEYDIRVGNWEGYAIIDYYHPSNRYPAAMNYALLEKVWNSKAFQTVYHKSTNP